MKKISDIFNEKEETFSLEIFPPKTEKGLENLIGTIAELCELKPDFISCTYGAGGGSRERTLDLVEHIQNTHKVPSMAHLTCVGHSKDDIHTIIKDIGSRQIQNILALRGDPPQDDPEWQPGADNFKYSCELVAFIRNSFNDYFSIGVAGFPEGHILCKDLNKDSEYLKTKIDNGANFVITQFFFNNEHYFNYVERLRALGVNSRVLPGILPITNYESLIKFSALCGATVPQEIKDIFAPIAEDKEATLDAGIKFAIKQCKYLLEGGAPGLHFYSLNKLEPTRSILAEVR